MPAPENAELTNLPNKQERAGLLEAFGEDSDDEFTKSSSDFEDSLPSDFAKPNDVVHGQPASIERIFSNTQIFYFALTYMSAWESLVGNLTAVLWNGGPRCLAFGTIFVVVGALAQSASFAEMTAIKPIAGAQYHWTAKFCRSRHARFVTWVQGWMTCFAWISTLSGSVNFSSYIIRGIIVLNYDSYTPERWHMTVTIICVLLMHTLINMYTFRLIPWLETLAGILHIAMFVIFVGVLLMYAPKQSAGYVFTSGSNGSSGWTSDFVASNLGLLTPLWGLVGFDGAVHMSEDVRGAHSAVPRAMVWSIAINGVLAFIMGIVLLFCTVSPDEVLRSPYPAMTILINATGSHVIATAMCLGLLIIAIAGNLGTVASASRMAYAWARDGVLPSYFAYIDPEHRVPVRALWLPVTITMLLSLLNIVSSVMFGAFIALASMALFSCYMVAIACMLHARLTSPGVRLAAWNLGRWGVPINTFALIYSAYMFIWLPFPNFLPVTTENMNYAVVLWGTLVAFAVTSWWAWGRDKWPGLDEKLSDIVMDER